MGNYIRMDIKIHLELRVAQLVNKFNSFSKFLKGVYKSLPLEFYPEPLELTPHTHIFSL
jgi:hypothetical protein